MPDIDFHLYEDTKQNLISAAKGDPEIEELVRDQLADMKETGYFDMTKEDTEYDD